MSNHQTPASCIESLRASGYVVTPVGEREKLAINERFVQLIDGMLGSTECQESDCERYAVAEDYDDVDLNGNDQLQAYRLCLEHVLARLAR